MPVLREQYARSGISRAYSVRFNPTEDRQECLSYENRTDALEFHAPIADKRTFSRDS
jgi:hypothetical protein